MQKAQPDVRPGFAIWAFRVLAVVLPLAVLRNAADPTNLPKYVLLVVAGLVAGVHLVSGLLGRPRVRVDRGLVAVGATFLGAAFVAALTGPSIRFSLFGEYQHYAGLISYVAVVLVAVAVAEAHGSGRGLSGMLTSMALGTALVSVYAVLQALDWDPIRWQTYGFARVSGTLGNANVLAGYVAATSPLLLWLVMTGRTLAGRCSAGFGLLAAAVAAVASTSAQGPAVFVLGTVIFGFGWAASRGLTDRARRLWLVAGGVGVTASVAIASLVREPLSAQLASGMYERRFLWSTAWNMFVESPVTGVGLDSYGQLFTRFRPADHAVALGDVVGDAAHSVPLQLLATGGLLLFLAYGVVVIFTGSRLVRAWRQKPNDRPLVAALGAAWICYHVQSLVSFERPALVGLHWLLIGAVVAVSAGDEARPVAARPDRHRRGALAAAGLAAGALAFPAVVSPLRGDISAARGVSEARAGEVEQSIRSMALATFLAPYRGSYWLFRAAVLNQISGAASAAPIAADGATRLENDAALALTSAQLYGAVGEVEPAARWYREAVVRDPHHPMMLRRAAEYLREHGDGATADAYLERALELENQVARS